MDIIKSIEHEQMKNKIPELKVGNTVKVHARVKEGMVKSNLVGEVISKNPSSPKVPAKVLRQLFTKL